LNKDFFNDFFNCPQCTNREVLKRLYEYMHYISICEEHYGLYGFGVIPKIWPKIEIFMKDERQVTKTALNLFREYKDKCIICGGYLSEKTEGDHIIPLSKGGWNTVDNRLPLCRKCNSSKKDKDLLEWIFSKGIKIYDIDNTVLYIYLHAEYTYLERNDLLDKPAYSYLKEAWEQSSEILRYLYNIDQEILYKFKNFNYKKTVLIEISSFSEINKKIGLQESVDTPIELIKKRKESINQIIEYLKQINIQKIDIDILEWLFYKGIDYAKNIPLEKLSEKELVIWEVEAVA